MLVKGRWNRHAEREKVHMNGAANEQVLIVPAVFSGVYAFPPVLLPLLDLEPRA